MDIQVILEKTCDILQKTTDLFESLSINDKDVLVCKAVGCNPGASFCVDFSSDRWWVSLVTPDRWLSESIEADLMFSGDDLEELLEEELVELGYDQSMPCEHFRSENLLYTFRSPLRIDINSADYEVVAEVLTQCLLAYLACFRELGDVASSPGE